MVNTKYNTTEDMINKLQEFNVEQFQKFFKKLVINMTKGIVEDKLVFFKLGQSFG